MATQTQIDQQQFTGRASDLDPAFQPSRRLDDTH